MIKLLTLVMLTLTLPSAFADSCAQYRAKYQCLGTDKKPIHLSFDDGPANITPHVLDVLKRERIPATFFVLAERIDCQPHKQQCDSGNDTACTSYNYCTEHRKTLQRTKQEGHMIGSHSYQHLRLSTLPVPQMEQEIRQSKHHLQAFLTTSPPLFRLPYGDGWFNRDKKPLVLQTLARYGFKHIAWEMSAFDWRVADQQGDNILKTVMHEICSKRGGVILFHDGDSDNEHIGRTFTATHLEKWIPAMRCVADFKPLNYFYKDLEIIAP